MDTLYEDVHMRVGVLNREGVVQTATGLGMVLPGRGMTVASQRLPRAVTTVFHACY